MNDPKLPPPPGASDGSVDINVGDLVERKLADPGAGYVAHPSTIAQAFNAEALAKVVASAVAETFAKMPQFNQQQAINTTPHSMQVAQQQQRPNISDRGTAAPMDYRDSDGVINSRPLEATAHDLEAYVLKHGQAKGLEMFQARVLSALRGVRIKSPR